MIPRVLSMRFLITILALVSFQLVHAELIVSNIIIKCDSRIVEDGKIKLGNYTIDVASKEITKASVSDEAAATILWQKINAIPELNNGMLNGMGAKPTHVRFSFGEGEIRIDLRDGSVRWPGVNGISQDMRSFLDAIVTTWRGI